MLKIFISYSQKDDSFRKEFETSLSLLKREKIVQIWTDREIKAGELFGNKISENIDSADIIVPLLSPDFIASDYCYDIEMKRALERHDKGEALVVPIVIRPCSWKNSPFANFQLLPSEGKAIAVWENKDEAWLNIFEGLNNLCKSLVKEKKNSKKSIRIKPNESLKKIGIFGETASGKSTLCNAFLGSEVMRVSDLTPVTRNPQYAVFETQNQKIQLIDCPGIGESIEDDLRIEKIYAELFTKVDYIIWVLRADIRNYSSDQKFIERIKKLDNGNKKFCIALNMIDRIIFESQGWDNNEDKPNKSLELLIERKKMYISGLFQIIPNKIIPTVGFKKYNVHKLIELVINSISS